MTKGLRRSQREQRDPEEGKEGMFRGRGAKVERRLGRMNIWGARAEEASVFPRGLKARGESADDPTWLRP